MKFSRTLPYLKARAKDAGRQYLQSRVKPESIFEKLTGYAPMRVVEPDRRGQNSLMWRIQNKNGQYFKLFQLRQGQDVQQLEKLLSLLNENKILVPRILEADAKEGWVLSEWLEGEPLCRHDAHDFRTLKKVAEIQALQNCVEIERNALEAPYSYFHKVVLERYIFWTSVRLGGVVETHNDHILQTLLHRWPEIPQSKNLCVTNPDFSFANLIKMEDGQLAMIDTEFVSADKSPAFELANFLEQARFIDNPLEQRYLSLYEKFRRVDEYIDHAPFWRACVELKRVGKAAIYWRSSDAELLKRIQTIGETLGAY